MKCIFWFTFSREHEGKARRIDKNMYIENGHNQDKKITLGFAQMREMDNLYPKTVKELLCENVTQEQEFLNKFVESSVGLSN